MDDTGEHLDRFITLYLDTMRRQNAAAEYFFRASSCRGSGSTFEDTSISASSKSTG